MKLIDPNSAGVIAAEVLTNRPFTDRDHSFEGDARRFVPGESLTNAMNTAITVGEPLLITGEPGTGKTQAGYYAAYKLGLEPAIHFQVKSDSTARDLLYYFDTVRYFHDAHLVNVRGEETKELNRADYVERRALWQAFTTSEETTGKPCVVLIDEIDKAPRDFPNDLLHELDKMEFTVSETGQKVQADPKLRPILFITSNSERRLPEPFLRRCVYHHIKFDDNVVRQAVDARRDEYGPLSDDFIKLAITRFVQLRERGLRNKPATGELLVWLRVLALTAGHMGSLPDMPEDFKKLPFLECLLKDHQDMEEV